jgi:hypothetical protein
VKSKPIGRVKPQQDYLMLNGWKYHQQKKTLEETLETNKYTKPAAVYIINTPHIMSVCMSVSGVSI